jgi:pyridinium-3,5-bisthiocarboxylic acid mononucleotide nickel chelatase
MTGRTGWLDASGGISGDMLLGACLDAGAGLGVLQRAIDGLRLPERIEITAERVQRGGLAAVRAHVTAEAAQRARSLGDILDLLGAADLDDAVRDRAGQVFRALAEAEALVHGQPVREVHFHEVGALDSLADVVGAVAGLQALGVERLVCSPIALGGGRIATAHGTIPLPGPAVLELLRAAGAPGAGGPEQLELATPTGVAVAVTLAAQFGPMPPIRPERIGTGAGHRDPPGHANVTRLVIGAADPAADEDGLPDESTVSGAGPVTDKGTGPVTDTKVVLEANVDDLDPRLGPPVLAALLAAGADDAWLTPILMKKGRPAHTLSVLAAPVDAGLLRRVIFTHTTTIGLRQHAVDRTALGREIVRVQVPGGVVRVKLARLDGAVVNAVPEYEDVLAVAAGSGQPPKAVLDAARAAAGGLVAAPDPGAG